MFGFRFIKVQPTTYLLQYRNGKLVREGAGLSFFYFAPSTSLVSIPIASVDMPFIFAEVTADFQNITIQGQVTYRVSDPKTLSKMLNFVLNEKGTNYISDDPTKLPQRIINLVQVHMRAELQSLTLRQVLHASELLVSKVSESLPASNTLQSLGIEILGLSILEISPNPETARALEAQAREQLLRESDEAIYARRNASVEQERAIKENELNTEIAIENKKREIRETQMDAERIVQEKQRVLNEEKMAEKIALEERNKELVSLAVENMKNEADAKAYSISVAMKAVAEINPKIVQALTSVTMEPAQIIAMAFQELAGSADKIGQLNISPDMLQELLKKRG